MFVQILRRGSTRSGLAFLLFCFSARRGNIAPNVNAAKLLWLSFLLLCSQNACAQSTEKEKLILEIGGAASRSISDSAWSFGPSVAAEVTPIENWLELEAGVTSAFRAHSTEWDTDLLFKKPWTLSSKLEFMIGVGPEWVHASDRGVTTNSPGVEAALDFMFWPSAKHKFGWYVEPAYDHTFGRSSEQSAGVTGGLLIVIH